MNVLDGLALGGNVTDPHRCSRAGCNSTAQWAIQWRNPKIHAADRVKTWLSCSEHETYLREFLAARSFPLTVRTIAELENLP